MITLVNVGNKTTFTLDSAKKIWFRTDLRVEHPMPSTPFIAVGSPMVLTLSDGGITRTNCVASYAQVGA